MQATDPPIPKSKCSQQQINLPLAASALCCHAKVLIQTVVQKKAELFMSSAFEHSVFLLKLYYVSSLHSASAFR